MNEQERQVISDIFGRLEQAASQPRDAEAERFIAERLQRQPYAPYAMAQAIYVQEQALSSLNAQMQDLQAEVERLRSQPQQSGGFLSSLFGGGAAQPGPQQHHRGPAPGGAPWAQPGQPGQPGRGPLGGAGGMGGGMGQPGYGQQPGFGGGPWGGGGMGMPQRQGSGFLGTALATAAGVGGGMLIGSALSNAFSGGAGEQAAAASGLGAVGGGAEGAAAAGGQDFSDLSPFQDASANDPSEDFGGDFGGDAGGDDWA